MNSNVRKQVYLKPGEGRRCVLFNGDARNLLKNIPNGLVDLVVTSPPYCMKKDYEKGAEIEDFLKTHSEILPEIVRVVRPGGSICWQVGYYMREKVVTPLDFHVYDIMKSIGGVSLRDRIIWTFGHGLHETTKFSGRHEVILWYSKGDNYQFNLDDIRVPQKYPGKRSYKGPKKGEYSGNPGGKNPSNVWDLPNVKAGHIEKTCHPCQFPVALAERLVLALTNPNGLVLDPFAGSGSTGVAALLNSRKFWGSELDPTYHEIAANRLKETMTGKVKVRPSDREIYEPNPDSPLVKNPFAS